MTNQVVGVPDFDGPGSGRTQSIPDWEGPLRDGVRLATEASELTASPFRFVLAAGHPEFGEAERPEPDRRISTGEPDTMFSALEAGEWEFLSTAAEQSAAGRPDRHGKTGGSPERPSLDALTGRVSRSFDERSAVSWLTTLRRVFTYQHDDRAAAQAREAVAARIAADCRVVIGDASGSVVAWETLAEHPELSVDTLLTLGSPLVIDDVYRRLRSFGSRPTDARLPNIRRWVNIFDPDDPAGFGRLDPHWPDVQDYGVDNGPDHAAVVSYLGKRITGRTVAEAFPENRR